MICAHLRGGRAGFGAAALERFGLLEATPSCFWISSVMKLPPLAMSRVKARRRARRC